MNIFLLDEDPVRAAQLNCDSHNRKIVLEAGEMLGYAFLAQNRPYPLTWVNKKSRHFNHPMSIAVRKGKVNFEWTLAHLQGLLDEFEYRCGKKHAYYWLPDALRAEKPLDFDCGFVVWPRCFGKLKPVIPATNSIVDDYRKYYILGKQHLRRYTKREIPDWFVKA